MIVTAAYPWRRCAVPGAIVRGIPALNVLRPLAEARAQRIGRFNMALKAPVPAPVSGELYYRIPESAHEELGHIRGELSMLARLTLRDCCDRDEALHLSAAALSQCFARLAVEVGEIMDMCLSNTEYEASVNHSQH